MNTRTFGLAIGCVTLWVAGCTPQASHSSSKSSKPAHSRAQKKIVGPLFTQNPPADPKYRAEIEYMHKIDSMSPELNKRIRDHVRAASDSLSIPQGVLWCVLFQESRLDRLKNAFNSRAAKGIGQFTSIALDELNRDTDLYDARTSAFLRSRIAPKPLPITFSLKGKKSKNAQAPATSYYRLDTGVASTAAYLNNRYQHLLKTLERRNLRHDPQVTWLLAAAAYNKGPRAMNVFLHRVAQTKGQERLRAVLHDPDEMIAELSDEKSLNRIYYYLWERSRRGPYVEEIEANIQAVSRCALARSEPKA